MGNESTVAASSTPIEAAVESVREHVETLQKRISGVLYGDDPDLDNAPESSGLLRDIEQIDMILVGMLDALQL